MHIYIYTISCTIYNHIYMCGEGWEVGLRSRSSESKWDGLVSCVEWGAICGVGGVGMEWVVVCGLSRWGVGCGIYSVVRRYGGV